MEKNNKRIFKRPNFQKSKDGKTKRPKVQKALAFIYL